MRSQRDTRILVQVRAGDDDAWLTLPVISRNCSVQMRFRPAGVSWELQRFDVVYAPLNPAVNLVLKTAVSRTEFQVRIYPDGDPNSLRLTGKASAPHCDLDMSEATSSFDMSFVGKNARLFMAGQEFPSNAALEPASPPEATPHRQD